MVQKWSYILCFTLSPGRLEPVSRSMGFRIEISLQENLTALGQSTFFARGHRQREQEDFSGNLVQTQPRCVKHTGIQTCSPPAQNKAWRQYSCKLSQSTTFSGSNQAWRPGICDTLCQAMSDMTQTCTWTQLLLWSRCPGLFTAPVMRPVASLCA